MLTRTPVRVVGSATRCTLDGHGVMQSSVTSGLHPAGGSIGASICADCPQPAAAETTRTNEGKVKVRMGSLPSGADVTRCGVQYARVRNFMKKPSDFNT